MTERKENGDRAANEDLQRCDFCGELAESVRRVALDGSYERLRTRHVPQYACSTCSERKERDRAGC